MQWTCSQCCTINLEYLDACRVCGAGKDGAIKDYQKFEDWKSQNPVQAKVGEDAQKVNEAIKSIVISTGDIKEPYQILDAIFALDYHVAGFLGTANPSEAFRGVKTKLRQLCSDMGGDAVINCQFEYRVALATTAGGAVASALGKVVGANISDKSQAIEIFAYGTAVKLKKAEGEV